MADIIVSKQDAAQVLRLAYDDAQKAIRTVGSATAQQEVVQPDGSLLHTTVDQSALPDGASTEAKQDDQITQLNSIATTSSEVSANTLAASSTLTTIQANTAKVAAGLVTVPFDNQTISYVTSGNGIGEIDTVVYKLGATTVATVVLSYDAQNRLTGVARS